MKAHGRISAHPVLYPKTEAVLNFTWNGRVIEAISGETIMSALVAAGVQVFGTHPADGHGLGVFCANGQCSQCTVIADGVPVKACMTQVKAGMAVMPCNGLPELPMDDEPFKYKGISTAEQGNATQVIDDTCMRQELEAEVLIIGAGPSGLAVADELGKSGRKTIVVDDKAEPGGKLVLQTHKFFGSIEDCMAGTRGVEIGKTLADRAFEHESVKFYPNASVIAIYSDRKAGVEINSPEGRCYFTVKPDVIVVAAGAREKGLAVPGGTLPGVYGAGAFQTLVNRDLIKCSDRIFIIGGGNVGLIAGYHAVQAGMEVVGLAEAMPECGGYKVHKDKLMRLGVPVHTSHTVKRILGKDVVNGVEIVEVDENFTQKRGTEKLLEVDTVLVAVGLSPVDEFVLQAQQADMPCVVVGDANEIAEASAAIFSGRIGGRKVLQLLGVDAEIPSEWGDKAEVLKSRPGRTFDADDLKQGAWKSDEADQDTGVFPVIHCYQEIPCNPCSTVCPQGAIKVSDGLMGLPSFQGKCTGCLKCVAICPGLAITVVRLKGDKAEVTLASELELKSDGKTLSKGAIVDVLDVEGEKIESAEILRIVSPAAFQRTSMVTVIVSSDIADKVAGFRIDEKSLTIADDLSSLSLSDQEEDPIVCRCERVRQSEIMAVIGEGVNDLNQIKARTRAGMGACGGKTCQPIIAAMVRRAGMEPVENTVRPLFVEVPMGVLAGECCVDGEFGCCGDSGCIETNGNVETGLECKEGE